MHVPVDPPAPAFAFAGFNMADVEAVGLGAKCKVVVNRCERCWL